MEPTTLTVRRLIEILEGRDPDAGVYVGRLVGKGPGMEVQPVVWTAEKDGKVLLLDPDLFRALVVARQ